MDALRTLHASDTHCYDVIIVGAGVGALTVALSLPENISVAVIATSFSTTSSHWAKGGMAAAAAADDSAMDHFEDTLRAGSELNDASNVRHLVNEAPQALDFLRRLGVNFAPNPEREAGHRRARIWHARGDATGAAIMDALDHQLNQVTHITRFTGRLVELLRNDDGIAGCFIHHNDSLQIVRSAHVVLGTGGATALWSAHTSPNTNLGQGIILAYLAGATVGDLEFTQFHPTALALGTSPLPLATEALRGAGAWIIDAEGKRFLFDVDPAGELATRDKVSRALFQQKGPSYLDARPIGSSELIARFPAFLAAAAAHGVDPTLQPVPIQPAAHYSMGGIITSAWGATTVPGLFAVGECANTGVHGANRLASNSLLEGVVYGRRIAEHIVGSERKRPLQLSKATQSLTAPRRAPNLVDLRALTDEALGIERDETTMLSVQARLASLETHPTQDPVEAIARERTAMLLSLMITAARERKGSVGAHARSDHQPEDALYRLTHTKASGMMRTRRTYGTD